MIPMKHQKTLGPVPWDPFLTSYSNDYKPLNERYPEVTQWKPSTEAKAAPASINPPQTARETWPVFHRYYYKTTNDTYGSRCCSLVNTHSTPPCWSPFHAFLPTFGTFAPSISETSGVVGSTLTKEAGAARGIGPLLGEEKGQLHYVFGGKSNALEQQEAKDKRQQKIDILYEEGVIVVASHVGPASCEDILRCVCREAGLLHFPVTSSSVITIKDADSWGNSSYQSGLRPAFGLQTSNFLQPPSSSQYSCYAWKPECPNSCCSKMQTSPPGIPLGSTRSLSNVRPAGYRAEPCRTPWQTEYEASYAAGWAQP